MSQGQPPVVAPPAQRVVQTANQARTGQTPDQLPLQTGVRRTNLTPMEQRAMEVQGTQVPTMQVQPNEAQVITKRLVEDIPAPVDPETYVPPVEPIPVDLNSLPPEQRAQYLREMQRTAQAGSVVGGGVHPAATGPTATPHDVPPPPAPPVGPQAAPQPAPVAPQVVEAPPVAPPMQATVAPPAPPGMAPVQSQEAQVILNESMPSDPEPQLRAQLEDTARQIAESEAEEVEEKDAPEKENSPFGQGNCPYCLFDPSQPMPPEPTPGDVQDYVRYVMGAGQTRWFKTKEPLGGRIRVTTRSRTDAENRQIFRQLQRDVAKGRMSTPLEYEAMAYRYQLAVSLSSLEWDGNLQNYQEMEEYQLSQFVKDSEEPTGRPEDSDDDELVYYVSEALFSGWADSLYNMCISCLRLFDQVRSVLDARALEPDFWNQPEEEPQS